MKNDRLLNCMVLSIVLLMSSCGSEAQSPTITEHLKQKFAEEYIAPYVAGDTETWLDVFGETVVALHDGLPPLEGQDAIREFGNLVAQNFSIVRLDAVVDEVRREGDWAWTRGHFDALFEAKSDSAPPGVAGERRGKFLLIWERQANGEWLVIMDMGNSLRPSPENN